MIEIRPYEKTDDLLTISNIYEQSWKYAYRGIIPDAYLDSIPSGQWANGFNVSGRYSLLLFDNGKLLGTSSFCKARMEDMEGYEEIVSIYLLSEAMHQGCGKKLMQAVVNELKKIGCQKIYLWVLEENISARRFYERFGFTLSGRIHTDTFAGKELAEVQYTFAVK